MYLNPAIHLGCVLKECRTRGYEFDKAWELAMRSLPRGRTDPQREYLTEWKDALRWAKGNFRIAYGTEQHERDSLTGQPDHAEVTGPGTGGAGAPLAGRPAAGSVAGWRAAA
jgi:hypothetical protein